MHLFTKQRNGEFLCKKIKTWNREGAIANYANNNTNNTSHYGFAVLDF